VVDINYFPGIAKMPGYSDTFCNFLRSAKDDKRRLNTAAAAVAGPGETGLGVGAGAGGM
jgi:hypothetical protein